MRDDMARLLVLTPRSRAYGAERYKMHRRNAKQEDLEAGYSKRGMRREYINRKYFSEYFAPLMGFLEKHVGCPWNDIYSELSQALKGGGTIIQHVKGHLFNDFVAVDVLWRDGEPYRTTYYRPLHRNEFYVDGEGLLRRGPPRPKRAPESVVKQGVRVDADSAYHLIGGLWYRVWEAALPKPVAESEPLFDVALQRFLRPVPDHGFVRHGRYRWLADGDERWASKDLLVQAHGRYGVYGVRRMQIDSRTIRRANLRA